MFYISILALTTAAIAGSAAYFSVYGLANLFVGYFWSVVIMGVALEAGKLVAASFLYRYWTHIGFAIRGYLMAAVLLLMTITSVGIFGYLSTGYQSDTLPYQQLQQQLQQDMDKLVALNARKQAIDSQVSQLKTDDVRGRQRLMASFNPEIKSINVQVAAIETVLAEKQKRVNEVQAHIGPIIYIAKAMGMSTDDATVYIIILLILVFDPLAIVLTICTNIALRVYADEKRALRAVPTEVPIVVPVTVVSAVDPVIEVVVPTPTEMIPEIIPEKVPEVVLPEPEIVQESVSEVTTAPIELDIAPAADVTEVVQHDGVPDPVEVAPDLLVSPEIVPDLPAPGDVPPNPNSAIEPVLLLPPRDVQSFTEDTRR